MASLIDKLRAAQPIKNPKFVKSPSDSCYTRHIRYPSHDFPLKAISRETLMLLIALQDSAGIKPENILFLDTETTGLGGGAGTVAFLVGIGQFKDGQFVVTQHLMRDYDEEIFVLNPVLEALNACDAVVTFNGASFDMPLLQSRLVMNGLHRSYSAPINIDLLHIARRVYKLRVKPCSLTQLENDVFHQARADDLPGSAVPERYFRYIKTREMALLDDILKHNAQDVLSMARLLYALINLHEQPLTAQDQRDLFSLGRVFKKRGECERAKVCFRACGEENVKAMAQMQLADIFRREGRHGDAADVYERMRYLGVKDAKLYINLAKIYEHRFKAPERALAIARQGMLYCLECADFLGLESLEYKDLEHRSHRLIKKLGG